MKNQKKVVLFWFVLKNCCFVVNKKRLILSLFNSRFLFMLFSGIAKMIVK